MYIATHHHTLLAADMHTGLLQHVWKLPAPDSGIVLVDVPAGQIAHLDSLVDERARLFENGPLAGCEYLRLSRPGTFSLRKAGFLGCAEDHTVPIVFNRTNVDIFETFEFVSQDTGVKFLTLSQGLDAFAGRVKELQAAGRPVCLHFGCGTRIIDGFLNIDKYMEVPHFDNYFIFDFVECAWPIPDGSVDYIYSEDFIEHLPQKYQLSFLTESFRVLKPNCFNRVNAPCLYASMTTHSDFSKGFAGFYFGEYDKWSHISLFTQRSLEEVALMIGYRRALFTAKSKGTSPHAVSDNRPGDDRDPLLGNIFADLMK